MPLTAPVGSSFEITPEGVYKARCIRIIDMGTTYNEKFSVNQHKIMIMWELPETQMAEGENKGLPFSATMFPTLSLHKKSNLRPFLESWRAKKFTDEEAITFDILKLLDHVCMLNIIHNENYANIAAIMPLKKDECPARVNDLVSFSFADFDGTVLESFSEKMQARIKLSNEYKILKSVNPNALTSHDTVMVGNDIDVPEGEIPF